MPSTFTIDAKWEHLKLNASTWCRHTMATGLLGCYLSAEQSNGTHLLTHRLWSLLTQHVKYVVHCDVNICRWFHVEDAISRSSHSVDVHHIPASCRTYSDHIDLEAADLLAGRVSKVDYRRRVSRCRPSVGDDDSDRSDSWTSATCRRVHGPRQLS